MNIMLSLNITDKRDLHLLLPYFNITAIFLLASYSR